MMPHAAFIITKGYHVGSKWFAEEFNRNSGCSLFFEYEHCLRHLGKQLGMISEGRVMLPSPENSTLQFLRHGCNCNTVTQKMHRCNGCSSTQLALNGRENQVACHAAGISFGALGDVYIRHIRVLMQLYPKVALVVHVRSNHVKHALSHLRISCGDNNHATGVHHGFRMILQPALLLAKVRTIARGQSHVVAAAADLVGEHNVAYFLLYEKMQQDMAGEIVAVLHAVGAPLHVIDKLKLTGRSSQIGRVGLVKAGAEDAQDAIVNYDEVERYFRAFSCLRSMLVAHGPVSFSLHTCKAAFEIPGHAEQFGGRQRLQLNASECVSRVPARR